MGNRWADGLMDGQMEGESCPPPSRHWHLGVSEHLGRPNCPSLSLSVSLPPSDPLSSTLISGGSVVLVAESHFTVWPPLVQLLIPFRATLTIQVSCFFFCWGFFFFPVVCGLIAAWLMMVIIRPCHRLLPWYQQVRTPIGSAEHRFHEAK